MALGVRAMASARNGVMPKWGGAKCSQGRDSAELKAEERGEGLKWRDSAELKLALEVAERGLGGRKENLSMH